MKTKKLLLIGLLLILLALMSSCAPGDGANTPDNPAGLLSGIWHGWIARRHAGDITV